MQFPFPPPGGPVELPSPVEQVIAFCIMYLLFLLLVLLVLSKPWGGDDRVPAEEYKAIRHENQDLSVTRSDTNRFDARFVCPAMFVPCFGARDEETAQKLSAVFKRGDSSNVRTLRRNSKPDDTCWCAGNGWWLSSA